MAIYNEKHVGLDDTRVVMRQSGAKPARHLGRWLHGEWHESCNGDNDVKDTGLRDTSTATAVQPYPLSETRSQVANSSIFRRFSEHFE